jgi:hypothetical protein
MERLQKLFNYLEKSLTVCKQLPYGTIPTPMFNYLLNNETSAADTQ